MKARKILVVAMVILLMVPAISIPAAAMETYDSYIGFWADMDYNLIDIFTAPYEIQGITYESGTLPAGLAVTVSEDKVFLFGNTSQTGEYDLTYRVYFNGYEYDLLVIHMNIQEYIVDPPTNLVIYGAGIHPAPETVTIGVTCSWYSAYTPHYIWYRSLSPDYPSIKAFDNTDTPEVDIHEEPGTYYYCVGVYCSDGAGYESEIVYSDFIEVTWLPELYGPLYYWIPLDPGKSYTGRLIDNYPDEILDFIPLEGDLPTGTTVYCMDHCLYLDTTGIPEGTYITKWELALKYMGYYDVTLELHVGSGVGIPTISGISGGGTFAPGEKCTLTADASIASGDLMYIWYGGSSMSYSSMTELARGVDMTTFQPEEALGTRYFCFAVVDNSIAGTSEEGLYAITSNFAEVTWKKPDSGTPSGDSGTGGSGSSGSPGSDGSSGGSSSDGSSSGESSSGESSSGSSGSAGSPATAPALPSGAGSTGAASDGGASPSPGTSDQGGSSGGAGWNMVSIVTPTPAARSGRGPAIGSRNSGEGPNVLLIVLLVFIGLILAAIIIVVILLLKKRRQQ